MQQPQISNRSGLDRWADWFSPGRFALLLALLVAAEFPHVILGWQTFVARDYGLFAYPLAYFQRECFWHGQLPLWNPYNDCGVPFLAQWNTMPLYPPALFQLLLPLTWALCVFCLLHLWIAGMGMYWLARRWTGNSFAAAFAGLAFAFNGLTLNLIMWPSHIATLSWMPWVVFAVHRAWQEGGRKIPLAAFVGALQMLAGGPETILFTWLLLAALWLTDIVPAVRTRTGLVTVWRLPLVVLLVAGLAAAQLLPFLDLAAHSQREQGYADTRWSMPATGWVNFLVPMAFGHVGNLGIFFQRDQGWTSSYYLGGATVLLALLAVWMQVGRKGGRDLGPGIRLRDPAIWLFIFVAVLALLVSFGDQTFISRGLRTLIPQLTLMTYPVKYVTVAVFLLPVLAALALARLNLSALENWKVNRRRVVVLGLLLLTLITAILLWAWRWPFPGDDVRATMVNGLARAVILLVAGSLVFLMTRADGPPWKRWAPLALLLVAWLDVLTHEPAQNPTVSPWVCQPGLAHAQLAMQPQPALGGSRVMVSPRAEQGFLKTTLDPQNNFLAKRLGYFADANLLDAVPKVNGFLSLYPREHGRLMSFLYNPSNTLSSHLLDFMGVSQITDPDDSLKWRTRDTFLPLVTAGQRPVFLDDDHALSAVLQSGFDPAKVVFLPENERGLVTVSNHTQARVLSSHFDNEQVDAEVEAEETSLVMVAQTYFHFWRPYVDGNPVPLLRANYAFQAVQVPAGHHQVKLVYEDKAFKTGVIVSGLSFTACIFMLVLARGRNGRPALD